MFYVLKSLRMSGQRVLGTDQQGNLKNDHSFRPKFGLQKRFRPIKPGQWTLKAIHVYCSGPINVAMGVSINMRILIICVKKRISARVLVLVV